MTRYCSRPDRPNDYTSAAFQNRGQYLPDRGEIVRRYVYDVSKNGRVIRSEVSHVLGVIEHEQNPFKTSMQYVSHLGMQGLYS